MKVLMKNPENGRVKEIKVGWSWTTFFFAFFCGVPLFLRGLVGWGIVMAIFFCLIECLANLAQENPDLSSLLGLATIVDICLIVYLAATSNAKTARKRLNDGYTFLDPETDAVKYAKGKWGVS